MPSVSRTMHMEEIFTTGKLTGIIMTLKYHVDEHLIAASETWEVPEDEQLYVEDWLASKRELGPSFVMRGCSDTGLEIAAARALIEYVDSLPAE
jgi:predicted transglutaminase-like cysteine proteinase